MNRVYIIESNGGAEPFGWYPVYMYNTMELAQIHLKPLIKRWPDAYRIVIYEAKKPYRPEPTLRSARA